MRNVFTTDRYTLYLAEKSDVTLADVSLLETVRQKKIQYAVREDVKLEQHAAGSFLRECLTDYGIEIGDQPLAVYYNFKAKPYPENADIFYNISHSGNYLAIAVSKEEIGVDIEERKPLKIDLSGRILSDSEKEEYAALPEERKNDFLIRTWTRKESIGKCLGEGITANLWKESGDEFSVDTRESEHFYVSVALRNPKKSE